MSTDQHETPLMPCRPAGYIAIRHKDSNNSRRRRLCGWSINLKTGEKEYKSKTTYHIVRHPDGGKLPHSPFLVKRNKYVPHVGKKQLAKLS